MKPIEEKVKTIVEKNEYLTMLEKSEIICLCECYKTADQLAQQLMEQDKKLKAAINKVIELIEYEPDLYYLIEELKGATKE